MQVKKFILQSCKKNKYYLLKSTSLKRRFLKNIKMRAMKNEMPKQQVMNEMEIILFFLFLNVSKNVPSQVKAILDARGAPLE